MTITDKFFANLPSEIHLSPDIQEYLKDALSEVIHTEDAKEVAEPFLQDAGMDDVALQLFFEKLQIGEDSDHAQADSDEPRKLDNLTGVSMNEQTEPIAVRDDTSPDPSPTLNQKTRQKARKIPQTSPSNDLSEPTITAISQVSRFHTDTIETLSNDVDLKGVQLSIDDHELLVDTNLRLFSGVHYGLIGRNGVGKSTLLKAIGHGQLIGWPKNIRVLYVEQLEDVDTDQSVIDIVLKADKRSMRAKRDVEILQKAFDSNDADGIAGAVRQVQLQQLMDEKEEAAQIAAKRSSARGAEARKVLLKAEAAVEEAMVTNQQAISAKELSEAPLAAQSLLDDLYAQLDLLDTTSAESRARKILSGLGFSPQWQDGPLSTLSGGWRIRVSLACALFIQPDVLLLDEPTNHLDLPAILWLQSYLLTLPSTLVTVSHDRSFLNTITDEIIVFRKKTLEYHPGNYDDYLQNTENTLKNLTRQKENESRKRAHIEKTIQQSLRAAKKSGDDKKLGMVASRTKKLDRLGMEKNEKGHRFKVNRDRGGYHLTARAQIEVDKPDVPVTWTLPAPSPLRHTGNLLQVDDVSFSYPNTNRSVLSHVTLTVEMGKRIALLGANGQGKSTLISLLIGHLHPTSGTITHHPQCKTGYFSQHTVEQLHSLPPKTTALQYLLEEFPSLNEQDVRSYLGSFGISGSLATQPIKTLSGGQLVRLALTKAVIPAPHLLILDEPTNHLDMDTIEALVKCLCQFTGAVIVVSHDQYFVSNVAEVVYLVKDGSVRRLEGGVDEYVGLFGRT